MQAPQYQDRSWLREKYLEEGMSLAAIARGCGRSPETIRRWMKKRGIRLRTRCQARKLRLKRLTKAKNEEVLRSGLDRENDAAFLVLREELEDLRMFKDNPRLLELLGKRRDREIRARSDADGRRRERRRKEMESHHVDGPDYSADDQMKDILARFEKPFKD